MLSSQGAVFSFKYLQFTKVLTFEINQVCGKGFSEWVVKHLKKIIKKKSFRIKSKNKTKQNKNKNYFKKWVASTPVYSFCTCCNDYHNPGEMPMLFFSRCNERNGCETDVLKFRTLSSQRGHCFLSWNHVRVKLVV